MSDPSDRGEVVNISATDHTMAGGPFCRGIYVGVGGTVIVRMYGSATNLTFLNVPDGYILPVRADKVIRSGTTASNMVALM